MQTGVEPFGQYVVPDPPGAIGAIASGKAGPDPGDEHLVILSPSTRRAVKPGMEPERDTPSASQIHETGQIPRCFATKENLISSPWRSRPRLLLGYHAPP